MSSITPSNPSAISDRRRARPASVTLREDGSRVQSVNELMDPANKSLTDALRIAYRLLMLAIIVMIVLFAFSGVQQVAETERGVRTTFGRLDDRVLEPGLHFSWPQPIGDVIKIETSDQKVEEKKAFFPNLSDAEERQIADPQQGIQSLAEGGRDSLDPDTDGSLLTGDGFLVHTRWLVTYRRSTSSDRPFRTISSEPGAGADRDQMERQIVSASIRRAIVKAAAERTIDEVLNDLPATGRPSGTPRFSEAAGVEAQAMLKQLDAGLEIQSFTMREKMPPRRLVKEFNAVQSAQSEAAKARQEAEAIARQTLTNVAGDAAPLLLSQIDRYEKQLADGKTSEAAETLKTIQDIMLRRPVVIDGQQVVPTTSGEVAQMLADAEQYRSSVVAKSQSDATSFTAKLATFRANPQVFLTSEWSDALGTMMARENVQTMLLPPSLQSSVLRINRDPNIEKAIIAKLQQDEALKAQIERANKRQRELFERQFSPEATQ
ncbi:MAG: hypothetical protein K2W85_00990 [Phycisphaerales bacterium]|nr:hypothetical protein [Phycisphaerales bacterium]